MVEAPMTRSRRPNRPTASILRLLILAVVSLAHPAFAVAQQVTAADDTQWQPVETETALTESQISGGESADGRLRQVDQLVDLAFRQHPHLTGAAAAVQRESGTRFQSTRKPNPSLGYSASEIGNEGRSGQQGLFLAQEWVTAGKLEMSGQAGEWRTRAAQQRLEIARLQLSQRVQVQFWALIAARQRVELLVRIQKSLDDAVDINRKLLEAGEASRGTLLQSTLERNQIGVALRQASIDVRNKSQALSITVGMPQEWIDRVPSDPWPEGEFDYLQQNLFELFNPASNETSEDAQGPLVNAWQDSPELAEVSALIEAARWELRLAQVSMISNVDSYASLQHDAATNNMVVGIQVGVALPIHDRKTGMIEAARATVAQNQALLASRCRDLNTRWMNAINQFRTATEIQRAIAADLLPVAQQRFQLAQEAHQQGEIDYLELLTAQRSYLATLQSALDALEETALASVRLQHFAVEDF